MFSLLTMEMCSVNSDLRWFSFTYIALRRCNYYLSFSFYSLIFSYPFYYYLFFDADSILFIKENCRTFILCRLVTMMLMFSSPAIMIYKWTISTIILTYNAFIRIYSSFIHHCIDFGLLFYFCVCYFDSR